MKEPRDWDEDYILTNLPVGEFDWFEAKGSQVVKPESKEIDRDLLSKAISAFANSGGGTLVLGLKLSGHNWVVDNGGIFKSLGKTSTREWLEDIIPPLVEVPLKDFNVYEPSRRTDHSQIYTDKAIYIIQIGDSIFAPHQASDKRYYGRVAGKSRPLGHQFVFDIFGRRRDPLIDIEFSLSFDRSLDVYFLEIMILNHGRIFANYVNAFITIPEYLVHDPSIQIDCLEGPIDVKGTKYVVFKKTNTTRDPVQIGITPTEFGPARYEPILPGLYTGARIILNKDWPNIRRYLKDVKITWKVFADNAPARKGEVFARDIKIGSE